MCVWLCSSHPGIGLSLQAASRRARELMRLAFMQVAIDKTFPLADAAAGHEYLEAGKSTGKVLYKIA